MGLYLCIFDGQENEIDAIEVGSYADYGRFIQAVIREVENGIPGSVCPTLTLHHDSDGEWSAFECKQLSVELGVIEGEFKHRPPLAFENGWMREVAEEHALKPKTLYESFIDIEGDILIARLRSLCETSIRTESAILFQ